MQYYTYSAKFKLATVYTILYLYALLSPQYHTTPTMTSKLQFLLWDTMSFVPQ